MRTIVEEALEAKLTHESPKQDQILPHHTLTVLRGTTLGGGRCTRCQARRQTRALASLDC